MNMATTLAVYASICKQTNRPFVFPGSRVQWDSLTDLTDARQLAKQQLWVATTPAAANQAFNVKMAMYSVGNGCGAELPTTSTCLLPIIPLQCHLLRSR